MEVIRISSGAVLAVLAASAVYAKEVWRDPGVTQRNRLPARAVMVPCESKATALAVAKGEKPRTESKWLKSLNGEWDFKWKHDFYAKEWEKADKIAVPGCWQLQGKYDPALYTNAIYPVHGWNEGDPYVEPPKEYTSHHFRNPVGLYSRAFTVPVDWKGRRVVIHFGGVSSAMFLRVNGKDVGYSQDSRLPAEFDVTPFLKDGENALEVEVLKHCDGTFLEDQDFWRLSGIFRDVWLVAEGKGAPYDPTWYELCDRDGIYVVCEANIESHGAGYGDGPSRRTRSTTTRTSSAARTWSRPSATIRRWSSGRSATRRGTDRR